MEIGGRLECRVRAALDGGDRRYLWAEAVGGSIPDSRHDVLTERSLFAAADDEQRTALKNSRELDAALHGPWFERWLQQVDAGVSKVDGIRDPQARCS